MPSIAEFLGEETTDLDDDFKARKSANLLLWIIAGFFVLAFAWAALTKIDRTVRGVGKVVPSSKLQVVSNLEGGVIEDILVKSGQTVNKGDVLVRLSPTLSNAAFGSGAAEVDALQTRIARLNAEVRGASPSYGSGGGGQVAVERSLHAARAAELDGIMNAGRARAEQAQRMVAEAQSALDSKRSSLQAADEELAMIRPMAEKQIIAKVDLIKAENHAKVARNEVDAAVAALSRARSAVAEANAQTAQQRSDWKSRSGMELSQAQAELAAKRQELPALSDRRDRTVIRASMSGRINRVLVTTVGGTVSAGMPIAEIVPTEETLYIETQIRPADIGNVHMAQKSKVEITAYNSSVYGTLPGKVTAISPDAVLNEKTGESFYTVEVQAVGVLKDQEGRRLPIGTGMFANVSLLGDKRSVLSYLFSPITKLSETAFRE